MNFLSSTFVLHKAKKLAYSVLKYTCLADFHLSPLPEEHRRTPFLDPFSLAKVRRGGTPPSTATLYHAEFVRQPSTDFLQKSGYSWKFSWYSLVCDRCNLSLGNQQEKRLKQCNDIPMCSLYGWWQTEKSKKKQTFQGHSTRYVGVQSMTQTINY